MARPWRAVQYLASPREEHPVYKSIALLWRGCWGPWCAREFASQRFLSGFNRNPAAPSVTCGLACAAGNWAITYPATEALSARQHRSFLLARSALERQRLPISLNRQNGQRCPFCAHPLCMMSTTSCSYVWMIFISEFPWAATGSRHSKPSCSLTYWRSQESLRVDRDGSSCI